MTGFEAWRGQRETCMIIFDVLQTIHIDLCVRTRLVCDAAVGWYILYYLEGSLCRSLCTHEVGFALREKKLCLHGSCRVTETILQVCSAVFSVGWCMASC